MPQTGKHLISVVLTGQSVSTAGVLSDSTSVATVSAVIDGLDESYAPEREEINALNTTRRNEVVLSDGNSYTLRVFKVNNGSDPQPMRTLIQSFDYFKLVWVEGTGGSAKTATAYGVRGAYSDGFNGRGKQIASLELGPVDVGAAQVTYA